MKILGIGNALVDVLARLQDDKLLKELDMPKGSMNLIDLKVRDEIFQKLHNEDLAITTGGSAGNTCLALAYMDVPVGFIGKVGDNEYGKFYINEFGNAGVENHFIHVDNNHTGTAMTLITPDGERTFGTYLGVAAELQDTELEEKTFSSYTHFYIEGYLVQNHALMETALSTAKSLGLKTALDLASYNIVESERDFLWNMIEKYVDIVFANEDEARALTGKEPEEAIKIIGGITDIAVVKTGAGGSLVMHKDEVVKVPVMKKLTPIDTTAAGDYYAAGFFYGMRNNKSIEDCAKLGSLLAGEIIQVVGTKLSSERWNDIQTKAKLI